MSKNIKKSKTREKKLAFKFFICLVYLVVITILFVCSYKLYKQKDKVISWGDVESVDDYSYIEVSKMSEKFAYYTNANKEIHFVIEKEDTGLWHTYLIAIRPEDYDKFKSIIDYTYERTKVVPEPIKVYGYPVIIDDNLKNLAIKNISNFVPADNEVTITEENFNKYLTNSYLDTTISKKDTFDTLLFITFLMLAIMIILFIYTVFAKEDNTFKPYSEVKKKIKKIIK